MKWSTLGLVAVGIVAAVCAAVIVADRRSDKVVDTSSGKVQVVLATRPLHAMTVVDASSVKVEEVAETEAPEDHFTHPAQVIGKVLAVPLLSGQAFASSSFAAKGSGAYMATALAKGKRAFSVGVKADSALESLLYPGCTVDVVASFAGGGTNQERVSTALLQSLQVLAVGRRTVFVSEESGDKLDQLRKTSRLVVTLMVDTRQAQMLQLASEYGSISLALRNPTDTHRVPASAVSLNEVLRWGGARSSPFGGMEHLAAPPRADGGTVSPAPAAAPDAVEAAPGWTPDAGTGLLPDYGFRENSWDIIVIRGDVAETQSFPPPASLVKPAGAWSEGRGGN